jgi:hypothetical protein
VAERINETRIYVTLTRPEKGGFVEPLDAPAQRSDRNGLAIWRGRQHQWRNETHMNKILRDRPRSARPPGRRPRWWLAAASVAACLAAGYLLAPFGGTAASAAPGPLNCAPSGLAPEPCYSPQAYQTAYGVTPLLRRGIDGRGETVAVLALAQTPSDPGASDIRNDLAAFDTKFGLPRSTLHVVNTIAGSPTPYLGNNDELGDTEMVHAFAPGATLDIILVPASAKSSPANAAAAMTKAVREAAALHAAVLASSWSSPEDAFTRGEVTVMHAALEQARDQHVTVLGSSGDGGVIPAHGGGSVGVSLPASDPLVLGAGGTLLDTTPGGAYLGPDGLERQHRSLRRRLQHLVRPPVLPARPRTGPRHPRRPRRVRQRRPLRPHGD